MHGRWTIWNVEDVTLFHQTEMFLSTLLHLPSGFQEHQKTCMPGPSTDRSGCIFQDCHIFILLLQNLNSDFTDSALGSKDKSPLPYGNFQLRESTMQSILNNPKYGPRSELGINMYTYLKFGLPRVMPFDMEEVSMKLDP